MKQHLLSLVAVCFPVASTLAQEYYVRFNDPSDALAAGATQSELMPLGVWPWYSMDAPGLSRDDVAAALGKSLEDVQDVGTDLVEHAKHPGDPNDPMYHEKGMWGQRDMLAETARPHMENWEARNVTVGVLDSGIIRDHKDLTRIVDGYSIIPNSNWWDDLCSHGTWVAGCICADTNNFIGVSSLNPNVRLISLRVLDGCVGSMPDVVEIIGGGVFKSDIIHASLTWHREWEPWNEAMDYLQSIGVIVVVATGNSSRGVPNPSATHPWIISVGDHTDTRNYAEFTNRGADIYAPGADILSTNVTNPIPGPLVPTYFTGSGTSIAAPHVTSVLAAMISVDPDYVRSEATATILRTRLLENTDTGNLDAPHLNAAKAVLSVLPCVADWDRNGVLNLFDFLGYQDSYVLGDPKADLDPNGWLDLFDFLAYQNAFVRASECN